MMEAKLFRVFVSSTFSDLSHERNALHERVYPRLNQLCAAYEARFQAVDLRWGISDEATYDQQTMKVCLAEIERCQQVTLRPNFIVLLGDRYGWLPLPYQIEQDEFNAILNHVLDDVDQKLLDEWYRLDENAVPPIWILQPREGKWVENEQWAPIEQHLHRILEVSSSQLAPEQRLKYLASATEQEIERGVFAASDPTASTFCFFRTISDLPVDATASKYLDWGRDDGLDKTAQTRLRDLKQRLHDRLPDNIHEYEAHWAAGTISTDHLDQLCEDVYTRLSEAIRAELNRQQTVSDPLEDEITAHRRFGEDRIRHFVGRSEIITRIREYLMQPTRKPLTVYGMSGVGKTTIMGQMIAQIQAEYPEAELVSRFIGTTPDSSDIRALLESLCRQIARLYDPVVPIPIDYNQLVSTFKLLLDYASAERPLFVLLDALDQLSSANNAHELYWLPFVLPDHVHLISSTLPGLSLDILERNLGTDSLIKLEPMVVTEGRDLLHFWLTDVQRTLQPRQELIVLVVRSDRC